MDMGIDDAMALAYAVGNPQVEILGVTGTYGNVYMEQGVRNAQMILRLLGEYDIPVLGGLSHALCKEKFDRLPVSAAIHGEDGIGNVSGRLGRLLEKQEKESMEAVDFILRNAELYKESLIVVTTGPLTNIAEALRRNPEVMKMAGGIVMMGGALTVNGNVTVSAEANIYQDPQAAKEVFESGIQVTMTGLDVTMRSVLGKEQTEEWRSTGSEAGILFADMTEYYISQHTSVEKLFGKCYLHDPSAVICAVHPEWFRKLDLFMTVLTDGECAGRTVGVSNRIREKHPNVHVCIQADSEKVIQEFNNTLIDLFSNGRKK